MVQTLQAHILNNDMYDVFYLAVQVQFHIMKTILFLSGNILNNSIPIATAFTWNIIDVSGQPWNTLGIEKQEKIKEYFEYGRNNMSVWINVKKPIDKESLHSFIGVRLTIDIAEVCFFNTTTPTPPNKG